MSDHAVIVTFSYGQHDLMPIFAIEDLLENAIEEAQAGEFDGNEIAADGSDGSFYMYGPDGDTLLEVVRPILESAEEITEVVANIRYGAVDDGEAQKRQVRIK